MEIKDRNYPFIKNQYYPGKLMHAGDFIHEQEYGNKKLEFLNHSFYGYGIIRGLKAETGVNGGLCLKAGSALDGQGRIIVVPEDVTVEKKDIEISKEVSSEDFILGLCYAEQTVETERALLDGEGENFRPGRKAEAFCLTAIAVEEWERQTKDTETAEERFWDKRILYEDEECRLTFRMPKLVPSVGVFRVSIEAEVLNTGAAAVEFHCQARLAGGRFAHTGRHHAVFENREPLLNGRMRQEWTVSAQAEHSCPVVLTLSEFCIRKDGRSGTQGSAFEFLAQTVTNYDEEMKSRLADTEQNAPKWVALAHIKTGEGNDLQVTTKGVRRYAANPLTEEKVRHIKEEAGISKDGARPSYPPGPFPEPFPPEPPGPYPPGPFPKPQPPEPVPEIDRAQLEKILKEEYGRRIHRGVTVVEVPGRYKRGQVLYSPPIEHGFGAAEVLISCGRIYEDNNPAYWEKERVLHTVMYGAEALFTERHEKGWRIAAHALEKNIEEGTFRIAVTLQKGRKRNAGREVAISWTAVKTGW